MATLNENSAAFSHKIWNSKKQIITLANEQKKKIVSANITHTTQCYIQKLL